MSTWTHSATTLAAPGEVMDVLTDPEAAGRWSPFPFEVSDLDEDRLGTGTRARVAGSLAGVRVGFDLEVLEADEDRLRLIADGPIGLDVLYDLTPSDDGGSEVEATVSVRGGGVRGRMLARATDALLSAGALKTALSRITREAEGLALCPA